MRKATETPAGGQMTIIITRLGHDNVPVNVPVDSTVADTLQAAGIDLTGTEQLFVAGASAEANDVLEAGDTLSIVTPKQAA